MLTLSAHKVCVRKIKNDPPSAFFLEHLAGRWVREEEGGGRARSLLLGCFLHRINIKKKSGAEK